MVKNIKTKYVLTYIPERGDIVWVNFNPTRGHEQKGRRPALVLSPKVYNLKSGLMLACPVTSHDKNYPFEVFCETKEMSGFVLADQIKSMDWKERKVMFVEKVGNVTLSQVLNKIKLLLEM